MSPQRDRGVALLAAVVGLATLTVLATALARTSMLDAHLARNAVAQLQADALVRSGVAAAAVLLRHHAIDGSIDHLDAPWARDIGAQRLGPGTVTVTIEDGARRLDLGAVRLQPYVPRLLAALGLDPGLADAIADWTDPDDAPRPGGAERPWYLALPTPYLPRNAALASVAELRLVRGIDAATLARLAPHVSTAGERAVNPNTASRPVLVALAGSLAADRVLAARVRRPLDRHDLRALLPDVPPAALTVRGVTYQVLATGQVGDLRRRAEATLSAPPGVDPVVRAWRPLPDG